LLYQRKTSKTKIFKSIFYSVLIALFIISVFSCSRKASDYGDIYSFEESPTAESFENRVVLKSAMAREVSADAAYADAASGREREAPASYTSNTSHQEQARKRILTGGCTIRTASFAAGILEVAGIADKYKGWVESSSDNRITIRIPAENFRKAFDEILFAKDVVDKYEEADDVTDRYSDLSIRLGVLKNTRQRLEKLLAAETETEKKVPILREIKRIDDQIERIKADLEYLDKAIAYSKITVTFVSYSYEIPYDTKTVFKWVDSLDPFSVTIPNIYRKVVVPLSDDFAILKKRSIRYFHAETSDGTIFKIGTVKNNPEGDNSFWRKAIIHTIGPRFSEHIEAEAGDIKYVLFKPKGSADYRYLVGTVIKRKLIYVIEVYFPDTNSYEKWIDSINESLGELKIK